MLDAAYYMILILYIKLVKVSAPAPHPYYKVGVVFGMNLRVKQSITAYSVKL